MPDPVANPNGNGGQPPAGAGNNPGGQQSQQGQEPAWLNAVPEQFREEAKKSYLLQSDYTKKTSELAGERKSWEEKEKGWAAKEKQWNDFNARYQPFQQQLQKHWDKIAPILNGAAEAAHLKAQQNANTNPANPDPFEEFDLLPAKEQAKRLAEYTTQQQQSVFQDALGKLEQKFNQTIADHAQAFKNYLAIQTDAYDRKFQNPELNLAEYLKTALEFQNGQVNPLEAAYNKVTSEATMKKMQEEWLKKGREEALLEMKNQQITNGGLRNPAPIPTFGAQPMTRAQVAEAVRNEQIKAGRSWT